MKKHFFNATFWALLSLALWTTGCSDDDGYSDVDGQIPTMTLVTDHIESGAGHRFTIEGSLADQDGIVSVNLQCADLYLNNENNPKSLVTDDITKIIAASDGNLWICTYWKGVDYFDKQTGQFTHYNTETVPGFASNHIWSAIDGGNGLDRKSVV